MAHAGEALAGAAATGRSHLCAVPHRAAPLGERRVGCMGDICDGSQHAGWCGVVIWKSGMEYVLIQVLATKFE